PEVRRAAEELRRRGAGDVSINVAWGDVFLPAELAQMDRAAIAADSARRGGVTAELAERHVLTLPLPQLIRHLQIASEAFQRTGVGMYLKIGTSGTGGMGFNIPYTHSEERPSRMLLTKSALAGAHSLLLFLLARAAGAS